MHAPAMKDSMGLAMMYMCSDCLTYLISHTILSEVLRWDFVEAKVRIMNPSLPFNPTANSLAVVALCWRIAAHQEDGLEGAQLAESQDLNHHLMRNNQRESVSSR